MAAQSIERRVIQLEELVTHQDQLIHELNETIVQLRADQHQLANECSELRRQLDWLTERSSKDDVPADEKPPHY